MPEAVRPTDDTPDFDPRRRYTLEEWQALELALDRRFDFHDGYLVDVRALNEAHTLNGMAGGTLTHARIARNALVALDKRLDEPCEALMAEAKVQIAVNERYFYPDVLAVCELEAGEIPGSVRNPVLVIEVLSSSTEGYDRTDKWRYYRRFPSLRDYLLVSQISPTVELYSRRSARQDLWGYRSYEGLDASVEIPSLALALPLAELYRMVTFPPGADGEPVPLLVAEQRVTYG